MVQHQQNWLILITILIAIFFIIGIVMGIMGKSKKI